MTREQYRDLSPGDKVKLPTGDIACVTAKGKLHVEVEGTRWYQHHLLDLLPQEPPCATTT